MQSGELKLVQAFASLIHDQHILFRAQPTEERFLFLRRLIEAAFKARATSQVGVVSYLLLGASMQAIEDFFIMARSNETCSAALMEWEESVITHRGSTLWTHALQNSKLPIGVWLSLSCTSLFQALLHIFLELNRSISICSLYVLWISEESRKACASPVSWLPSYRSVPAF